MKLEEMCLKITDGSHFSPKEALTGYPMLSVKDMGDYDFCYDGCKYINEVDYLGMVNGGCIPQLNDILVAKDGNSSLEHIFIVREQREEAILSSIAIIRPNPEIVQPEYLCYVLKNPVMNKLIKDNYISGSAIPRVVLKDFKKIEILLPPLPVQKKIASILSSLDDKIELNTRMNKVLEEIARALFQRWFVAFEFPDAEGKPYKSAGGKMVESEMGRVPEGWKYHRLSEVCDSVSKKHNFNKDELIFLNTGDIENGSFLHNNYTPVNKMPGQAKKSIQRGDILYSEIRPINRHFAYVNFDSDDYVVSTKLMVIRSRFISGIRLYHYLTSPSIITQLQAEAESRSGTFPQIRFENLQQIHMLIATDDVEKQFSKLLELSYARITENIAQNTLLAEIRDSLLPKLMSGEIET